MSDLTTAPSPADGEETSTVGPGADVAPPAGRRLETKVAAGAFLALITVPGVLYVAGGRAPNLDNRTPTPPPPLASVAELDLEALSQLQDHLGETVPGRGLAVRTDAWADLNILRESPNPDVLLGQDGWLFLASSIDVPCEWQDEMDAVRREMERAAALVESTGRRWVTAVAPDKSMLYADRLDGRADTECVTAFTDAIQAELEADPPTGYVPTWDALREAEAASSEPIFHVHDTHWTSEGASVFARSVIGAMAPELLEDATFTAVDGGEHVGDLTTLYGFPEGRPARIVSVERPGVETTIAGGYADATQQDVTAGDAVTIRSEGGEVIDGRTVYWHDSFGEIALPQMAPFLGHAVALRKLPLARPWVSDVLAESDTIVYETVQRWLVPRWTDGAIVGQLAWAFRDELPTRTATPDADGWIPVDPEAFDVIAVQQDQLAEEFRGIPMRLEMRGSEERPAPQRDRDDDTPLIYDLSGHPGVTHVRLVTNDGEHVTPAELTMITTGTSAR